MFKNFLIIVIFFFLTNCAGPGTALLSPAITGAKTKSAHSAALSLTSSLSSKKYIDNKVNLDGIRDAMIEKSKKILKRQ